MLRNFQTVPYVPILSVRPAEMNALMKLPDKDKDALLPFILLRAWVGSHKIDNTLNKISDVYGDRPWVADIDPNYHPKDAPRPVHKTLKALKNPADGYANWCKFVEGLPNAIPCLQIDEIDELGAQLPKLIALGRGIAVRIPMETHPNIKAILGVLSPVQGLRPMIVLDYGQNTRDLLGSAAIAIENVRLINHEIPDASIVACATTFPSSFVGVTQQDIFERTFFNTVLTKCPKAPLIYGDRGSARAKPLGGGAAPEASRIDYPLNDEWKFYRVGTPPPKGFSKAARMLLKDTTVWNKKLHLWGTNQILLAAKDDETAIRSPVRATAVRINIHMHTQLHYDEPPEALVDTDDDWVD